MKYFIYLILFVLMGCSNQFSSYEEIPIKKSNRNIKIKFVEIELNTEPISYVLFDVNSDDNQLIIINKLSKALEVYDLENNKLKFSKLYNKLIGNPSVYGSLKSLEFCNYDSIFFLQDEMITFTDTSEVKYSIIINTDEDIVKNNGLIMTNLNHAPLYYNRDLDALSIESYCYSCGFYNRTFYLFPIHVLFNMKTREIKELPIKYPKRYLDNYYGFHVFVFRQEYVDKYILSFSAEPNVYVYDKINKEIIVKGGRSKYQVENIKPLDKKYKNDSNKKLKHITLEPLYKEFLYDKYRKLYYRFFLTGIDERNPDGTFNAWLDKEMILMVFDNDLSLIKEVNLGKGIYNSTKSFVGKQGLYLFKSYKRNKSLQKNKLYYDILEID